MTTTATQERINAALSICEGIPTADLLARGRAHLALVILKKRKYKAQRDALAAKSPKALAELAAAPAVLMQVPEPDQMMEWVSTSADLTAQAIEKAKT